MRHLAFINYLQKIKEIKIVGAFAEKKFQKNTIKNPVLINHFKQRYNFEKIYFKKFIKKKNWDFLNYCNKGFISSIYCLNLIKKLKPDLIIVYGSSILRGKLINYYKKRILNVHLGLSPYYRGSGTNIFPLINNEPEYIGATFMFLDKGIDTGQIIHQIRAKLNKKDTVHDIGNKLILRMFSIYKKLILNFDKIKFKKQKKVKISKFYKKKDFTKKNLCIMKENFKKDMIRKFLKKEKIIEKKIKLVEQSWI